MPENVQTGTESGVLRSKRDATRYQILVGIAERQPAVSQQEIADEVGITSQAVSNYLQELVKQGHVEKHGRGRYEVTKEGVDWLMSQTDALRSFVDHVSEDVIGQVEVESALATAPVNEGDRVSLTMRDGYLRATPGDAGSATAVAVTDAEADREVGVTDFEGVVGYELGTVTVVSVPTVRNGGSATVDAGTVARLAADHDIVAVSGTEAAAVAWEANLNPDLRFGTAEGVREAATKGMDVLLLVVADALSAHTDKLQDGSVTYEVVDASPE
ncbi:Crp/Fnr family transcriptional regulator [Halobacteriales archaeon SW_10_68_16]|jgi:putative transcriptional regulator|nr:MAG: Crp/Fnr family transcriptional regulator [Halobacteriales archaeon SW_10_68_16]